uniref:FUN14 family protein n=1 Tax=Methanococcus maripaludis (strain C6 / ATCC BAA-1332) TaxID=444158 RepID=A9AA84_METM6
MDIMQFVPDLGTGFITGFVVGWGIKMAMKVVIALMGLYVFSLIYLSNLGVISINVDALFGLVGNVEGAVLPYGSLAIGLIHSVSLGGGFAAGAAVGLKQG